ncbi:MAG: hypothetical protein JW986_10155 [Methanotrichaceae archaeon]|nr:hypothetical protein [Methanotrichaceae archaeon]
MQEEGTKESQASALIRATQEQVASTGGTSPVMLGGGGDIQSGRSHERVLYSPGDPVRIKKIIYPIGNSSYLLGDEIHIYVEIIPLVKELKDIYIHEYVDMSSISSTSITNISECYRLCQYNQFRDCKESASRGEHSVNVSNRYLEKVIFNLNKVSSTYLSAFVDSINRSEHIVYWYTIRPNVKGCYRSDTSLRFNDGFNFFPDVDHSVEIIVDEPVPRYEADISYIQQHVRVKEWFQLIPYWIQSVPYIDQVINKPIVGAFVGDHLEISYEIKYKGGAMESDEDNVTILFERSCDQYECQFDEIKLTAEGISKNTNNSTCTSLTIGNIKEGESKNIPINIIYSVPGTFTPPRIKIGINSTFIKFDAYDIVVDTWWQRNKDYLLAFVAIIGLYGGKELLTHIRPIYRRMWWLWWKIRKAHSLRKILDGVFGLPKKLKVWWLRKKIQKRK